jgi:outer membrane protein OmpA-like peptidoglycan-associated protein
MSFRLSHVAVAFCILAASQALAGCNTVAGFGRDVQWTGRQIERAGGGTSENKQAASLEESNSPSAGQAMAAAPTGNTVYFELGDANLSADARHAVDAAVADAKGAKSKIKVTGYTDTAGSPDMNEQLSMKRAEAVADELVAQGIPRTMIDVSGRGESDLAVPTGDRVVEPKNRRAIIEVST